MHLRRAPAACAVHCTARTVHHCTAHHCTQCATRARCAPLHLCTNAAVHLACWLSGKPAHQAPNRAAFCAQSDGLPIGSGICAIELASGEEAHPPQGCPLHLLRAQHRNWLRPFGRQIRSGSWKGRPHWQTSEPRSASFCFNLAAQAPHWPSGLLDAPRDAARRLGTTRSQPQSS